jgi:hypothetical protein
MISSHARPPIITIDSGITVSRGGAHCPRISETACKFLIVGNGEVFL